MSHSTLDIDSSSILHVVDDVTKWMIPEQEKFIHFQEPLAHEFDVNKIEAVHLAIRGQLPEWVHSLPNLRQIIVDSSSFHDLRLSTWANSIEAFHVTGSGVITFPTSIPFPRLRFLFAGLCSLELPNPGLPSLQALEAAELFGSSAACGFPALRQLAITVKGSKPVLPTLALTNLREVTLALGGECDLTPLSVAQELVSVSLRQVDGVRSFIPLAACPALSELRLYHCTGVPTLEPLLSSRSFSLLYAWPPESVAEADMELLRNRGVQILPTSAT